MKQLILASIVINILIVICTFNAFLALHDIKADYVSKSILNHLQVQTTKTLPTWTDTKLEWTSVTMSEAIRLLLVVSNLAILSFMLKRLANRNKIGSVQK